MKLLIIRHADPNYRIDGLTPKGETEARLLSKMLAQIPLSAIYVSPMGRAQKTAEYTLKAKGMTAETLHWLREFDLPVDMPARSRDAYTKIIWDLYPDFCNTCPALYDPVEWRNTDFLKGSEIPEGYEKVCASLDALSARVAKGNGGIPRLAGKRKSQISKSERSTNGMLLSMGKHPKHTVLSPTLPRPECFMWMESPMSVISGDSEPRTEKSSVKG